MRYIVLFYLIVGCMVPVGAEDAFEKHCVPCHKQKDVSLQQTFMDALLVYGGRENMKAGLAYYFRNPRSDTSVMDEDYIRKNGVKQPMEIDRSVLNAALDTYWEKYTVIKKLR